MQNGTYFITICAKDRHPLFGEVMDGKMVLSENGESVKRCIENIEAIYPSVLLDDYVVMPNHVHLLLVFLDYDANSSPERVVRQFKSAATKQIGFSPWQEGAYTKAILTAHKTRIVRQYIKKNPERWEEDQFALITGE